MAFYGENFGNRILEVLSFPLMHRCPELGILFDRCSIRELQEIFPTIVNSIFGYHGNNPPWTGWGLRTISKETNPQDFDVLYNFFIPLGPMFRLCYRLLNDAVKFECSLDLLPPKMIDMIRNNQVPLFYSDLVAIDPFQRTITSLSLNAFDYFILNFVVHGTIPLHRMYPAALAVHNGKLKTVYFYLTADYLCSFLPSSPDGVVMPTNICGTVKAPQPMPVQPQQPQRSPKYFKLSPISHFSALNKNNLRSTEASRSFAWRTETVLQFFIDIWLRYDVDESRDLPSSEFIRVVRILVKQIHAFGNSADYDNASMVELRKQSQPMMSIRIYGLIRSLIARWPLDSSMSVVLELWLSYIQPWRYTFNRDFSINTEIVITDRFEAFIYDNLIAYTQIFVQILPRFERLDFSSFRNVAMLHRLVKVFSQQHLPELLKHNEQKLKQTLGTLPPIAGPQYSPKKPFNYGAHKSVETVLDWESLRSDMIQTRDEPYAFMFDEPFKAEMQKFVKKICIAKMYAHQEIQQIEQLLAEKSIGIWKFIKNLLLSAFDEISPLEKKLQEIRKIPDILDLAIQSLAYMFEINLPEISFEHIQQDENLQYLNTSISGSDGSDGCEISRCSPSFMRKTPMAFKAMGDPALFPIEKHECTVLVRFLHQISCKINIKFCEEIQKLWHRQNFLAKISRQFLWPPMVMQYFDKSQGYSTLQETRLPARIILRPLASYKNLIIIFIFLIIGKIIWGKLSLGFFLLILLIFFYKIILALISSS